MASTWTTNIGVEKIGIGDQEGTWGESVNDNMDLIDEAISGVATVTLVTAGTSGSPNSFEISADGTSSNARHKFVEFSDGGDLGADVYVQLTPNDAEKVCFIRNSLTNQSLFVFQGTYNASRDLEIPNGKTMMVKFPGTGATSTVEETITGLWTGSIDVDNISIDGNTISATSGGVNIDPAAGSALVLDGTIIVDAGVVTGATSITSTSFVGALTGDVTGTADSATNVDIASTDGNSSDAATFIALVPASATGDQALHIDSSNLKYDALSNVLTITENSSGATADSQANIVLENSTSVYLQFLSATAGTQGVLFGDAADNNIGQIVYDHGTNELSLFAGATEAMLITSGRVGIGTQGAWTPDATLHVQGTPITTPSLSASTTAVFADGGNSNISVISGNASTASIFFGDTDDEDVGGVRYDHSTNVMSLRVGASNVLSVDGSGNAEATSISFDSGTNKLDTYVAPATFSPTADMDGTAGTFTVNTAVYQRVGDMVHATYTVTWTGGFGSGTGNLRVDLPVTASTLGVNAHHTGPCLITSGSVSTTNNGGVVVVDGDIDASHAYLYYIDSGGGFSQLTDFDLASAGTLRFSITYPAA